MLVTLAAQGSRMPTPVGVLILQNSMTNCSQSCSECPVRSPQLKGAHSERRMMRSASARSSRVRDAAGAMPALT